MILVSVSTRPEINSPSLTRELPTSLGPVAAVGYPFLWRHPCRPLRAAPLPMSPSVPPWQQVPDPAVSSAIQSPGGRVGVPSLRTCCRRSARKTLASRRTVWVSLIGKLGTTLPALLPSRSHPHPRVNSMSGQARQPTYPSHGTSYSTGSGLILVLTLAVLRGGHSAWLLPGMGRSSG